MGPYSNLPPPPPPFRPGVQVPALVRRALEVLRARAIVVVPLAALLSAVLHTSSWGLPDDAGIADLSVDVVVTSLVAPALLLGLGRSLVLVLFTDTTVGVVDATDRVQHRVASLIGVDLATSSVPLAILSRLAWDSGAFFILLILAFAVPPAAIALIPVFLAYAYFMVAWSLALAVVVVETPPGLRALRRSRELLSGGHWWFAAVLFGAVNYLGARIPVGTTGIGITESIIAGTASLTIVPALTVALYEQLRALEAANAGPRLSG